MTLRQIILLGLLSLVSLAYAATGQEPVSQAIQPAFVPPVEGNPGVYFGKQKPWRLPRQEPGPIARGAVQTSLWRGLDAPEPLAVFPRQEPSPAGGQEAGAGAQQGRPSPASGTPEADPREASLLDALRSGPDGPALQDALRFGLTLNLTAAFTEALDSYDLYNRMRIRSARIDLEADVGRSAELYLTGEFGDVVEDNFLLREAGVLLGGLPGARMTEGFSLRAGRFYADLGAWNTVLPGSFPGPEVSNPGAFFLGGNLALTGVNVHHDLPFSWGHFRWSAAVAGDVERHSWQRGEIVAEAADSFGRLGADNLASTARISAQFDRTPDTSWRVGASAMYVPNEVYFADDGMGGSMRTEQEHGLWGMDAGVLYRLPGSEAFHEFAIEMWVDDLEDPNGASDPRAGQMLLYRIVADEHWSAGLQLSRNDLIDPLGPDSLRSSQQAWISYAFDPSNRLSFFGTHQNPGPSLEKFFTVGFEWTLEIGATRGDGIARWRSSPVTVAAGPTHPTARL